MFEWVKEVIDLGVGEIYLSSVDRDGTELGYDIKLAEKIMKISKIPVVIASGAHTLNNIKLLLSKVRPSGISIGSALHYERIKIDEILNSKWLKS